MLTPVAPIIRDVEIKYETVFFNSTLYGDKDSIYRQQPSREVDEAWNALGINGRYFWLVCIASRL